MNELLNSLGEYVHHLPSIESLFIKVILCQTLVMGLIVHCDTVDFIVILVIISSCKRENVKNGTNIS